MLSLLPTGSQERTPWRLDQGIWSSLSLVTKMGSRLRPSLPSSQVQKDGSPFLRSRATLDGAKREWTPSRNVFSIDKFCPLRQPMDDAGRLISAVCQERLHGIIIRRRRNPHRLVRDMLLNGL